MKESNTTGSRNLLAALRALHPGHAASLADAQAAARAQAELIRSRLVPRASLQEQLPRLLPTIRTVHDPDLPVAGSAHWNGEQWIIVLSSDEGPGSDLTLLHLLKRIVDHGQPVVAPANDTSPSRAAELVADYFASCFLDQGAPLSDRNSLSEDMLL